MYFPSIVAIFSVALSQGYSQEYTATPLSVSKCPVLHGKELDYSVGLDDEPDGSKSFKLNTDLDMVLDQECTYKVNVDILSGPTYIHYMEGNGNVCEGLANVIKPAWERFKSSVKPPVKESCTIKPGKYSLSGFQVKKDELDLPIPSKGQFRTDMHLFCQNQEVACMLIEVLITEDE